MTEHSAVAIAPIPAPQALRATPRRCAGAVILVAGSAVALQQGWLSYGRLSPTVNDALTGGLIAAAATALGTVPVALSRQVSRHATDMMLGFGAGVMLAASVFSLIAPALQQAREQGASAWGAGLLVSAGILLGAAFLYLLGHAFSGTHGADRTAPGEQRIMAVRRAWLFVTAITLHNMPEGAAIGVAFAGMNHTGAVGLATGIGIQDIPEGLAVALALRAVGYPRFGSVLAGIGSGLVEPLFAVLGAALVTGFATLLPWGLAGAAGAMLFVIANDVIPETHREGHGTAASLALMSGFVVMLVLDTALSGPATSFAAR